MSEQATQPAQNTPTAGDGTQSQTQAAPAKETQASSASTLMTGKEADAPKAGAEGAKAEAKTEGKVEAKAPAKSEEKKEGTEKGSEGKPVVPEKYDLKLPKDSHIDAKRLEAIASFAKEKGLSQEQAQAIVERENDAVSTYKAAQQEQMKQKGEEWIEAVKGDKEIGGQNLKQNVEFAKRALDQFGSATLKQQLNETGLGNHPELVRAFARIGKAMADDKLVLPGNRESGNRSVESILYGDSTSKES